MMDTLEKLIEALRNELQQYGEMLALLDHQQEMIRLRGADDILHTLSAINTQSASIVSARQNRQTLQQKLAWSLQQPHDSTFAHLLPMLPEHYQLLISALVQENNELLERVSARAQENQKLLHRSLELMQRFITTLSPEAPPIRIHETESQMLTAESETTFYEAIR
jgi:hypothetical protein